MLDYQKVCDVVEESTTNNWQEQMARMAHMAHPVALAAFHSCIDVSAVIGCVCHSTMHLN